jgi:hypothetical protein
MPLKRGHLRCYCYCSTSTCDMIASRIDRRITCRVWYELPAYHHGSYTPQARIPWVSAKTAVGLSEFRRYRQNIFSNCLSAVAWRSTFFSLLSINISVDTSHWVCLNPQLGTLGTAQELHRSHLVITESEATTNNPLIGPAFGSQDGGRRLLRQ